MTATSPLNLEFIKAARLGDTTNVKRLLLNPQVDPTCNNNEALEAAGLRHNYAAFRLIMDDNCVEPISFLLDIDNTVILKMMLKCDKVVNHPYFDENVEYCMCGALRNNFYSIVAELLENTSVTVTNSMLNSSIYDLDAKTLRLLLQHVNSLDYVSELKFTWINNDQMLCFLEHIQKHMDVYPEVVSTLSNIRLDVFREYGPEVWSLLLSIIDCQDIHRDFCGPDCSFEVMHLVINHPKFKTRIEGLHCTIRFNLHNQLLQRLKRTSFFGRLNCDQTTVRLFSTLDESKYEQIRALWPLLNKVQSYRRNMIMALNHLHNKKKHWLCKDLINHICMLSVNTTFDKYKALSCTYQLE